MNSVRNAAFRRGFYVGLSSPYGTLFDRPTRYVVGPKDLVTPAWRDVGRSVREALAEEAASNGETTRPPAQRK